MSDFQTIERIARQLCEEHGGAGHWDAKGTKRAHWRKRAARVTELGWGNPRPVIDALLRACGWKA